MNVPSKNFVVWNHIALNLGFISLSGIGRKNSKKNVPFRGIWYRRKSIMHNFICSWVLPVNNSEDLVLNKRCWVIIKIKRVPSHLEIMVQ